MDDGRRGAQARGGPECGSDPRGVRARAGRSCRRRRQGRAPGPGRRRRVGRLARLRLRRQLLRRDGRVRRRPRQLVPLCVRRLDAAAARRVALPRLQDEAEEAPRREAAGAAPVASEEEGEPRPLERRAKGPRGARGARREGAAATLRGRHGPGRPRPARAPGSVRWTPKAFAPLRQLHGNIVAALKRGKLLQSWEGKGSDVRKKGYAFLPASLAKWDRKRLEACGLQFWAPEKEGLDAKRDCEANWRSSLLTRAGRRPEGAEGPRGGRGPREGAGRGEVPEVRLPRESHRAAAELAQRRAAFASSSRFPHARGLWRRHRDDPDGGAALDHSLAQGHGIRL